MTSTIPAPVESAPGRRFLPGLCSGTAMALAWMLAWSVTPAHGQTYTSQADGVWNGGAAVWTPAPPANGPQTGAGHTAIIDGHNINYPGGVDTGGSTGGDLTLGNGGVIHINNGGILRQDGNANWMRLGDHPDGPGTLNINDGIFRPITPGNVIIGTRGGTGIINVGDGSGAANSAIFDLQTANRELNLGQEIGGLSGNGHLTVFSDGVLEGGTATIRVGRHNNGAPVGEPWQSSLTVQDGGRFNARATVEAGALAGAHGTINVIGTGSLLAQTGGDMVIGWFGNGTATVTDGGAYTTTTNDFRIGREAGSTGTVTVSEGGTVTRNTGSWAWVGQNGTGTLNLESGGQWRELGNSQFRWGGNTGSSGNINISGPTFDSIAGTGTYLETHQLSVGWNGTALVTQTGGTLLNRGGMWLSQTANASSTYNMSGGELILNQFIAISEFGTSPVSPNAILNLSGSALVTQTNGGNLVVGANTGSYGRLTMADSAVINTNREVNIGRLANSRGELIMTGGAFNHSGDTLVRIGENGRGSLELSGSATFTKSGSSDTRIGEFNGSQGSLLIDGATYSQTGGGDIRVGHNAGSIGEVTIRNGGLLQRSPTNWANLGQSGSGTLTLESGGQWRELGGSNFRAGMNVGASATINISGPTFDSVAGTGTLLDTHQLAIADNGTATVNQSGGTVISRGGMWVTLGANGSSTYNMSGGELIANQWFVVSENGTSPGSPNATLNLSGSATISHTNASLFIVGANSGSYGRINVSDSATINTNRPFTIGRFTGSRGEIVMTGGTISQLTGAGVHDFFVGENGTGLLDIGDGATVFRNRDNWAWVGQNATSNGTMIIRDGGLWNSTHGSAQLRIANAAGSVGEVVVEEGGTLSNLGSIVMGDGGGTATLMVNGTLDSNNAILVGTTAAGGAGSATLGGSGVINADVHIGQRGTLMPGNSPGTLDLFGTLTVDPGAEWALNFDGANAGTLALNGSFNGTLSNITLTEGNVFDPTANVPLWALNNQGQTTFNPADIFANASATAPAGTSLYPDATGWVELGGQYLAFYTSADFGSGALTGGNDIVFFAIPEPGRALLLGLAGVLLLLRRRR